MTLSGASKFEYRHWAKSKVFNPQGFNSYLIQEFLHQKSTSPNEFWGAFWAITNEPSVDWLELNVPVQWAFPKIKGDQLKFYHTKHFEPGSLGILEPVGGEPLTPEALSGFFIPGLLFDNRGIRLGRGKSFYDRFLHNHKGIKVGLTYKEFFIKASLPQDPWDIPMDFVITENFIYQPLKEETREETKEETSNHINNKIKRVVKNTKNKEIKP